MGLKELFKDFDNGTALWDLPLPEGLSDDEEVVEVSNLLMLLSNYEF